MSVEGNYGFSVPVVFFDKTINNHWQIFPPNWVTEKNCVVILYVDIVKIFWTGVGALFFGGEVNSFLIILWVLVLWLDLELISASFCNDFFG